VGVPSRNRIFLPYGIGIVRNRSRNLFRLRTRTRYWWMCPLSCVADPGSKRHRIPDPDPQHRHWVIQFIFISAWSSPSPTWSLTFTALKSQWWSTLGRWNLWQQRYWANLLYFLQSCTIRITIVWFVSCGLQNTFLPLDPSNQCCGSGSTCFWASWIRIHESEVWIRIRILLSSCKNSKTNFDS
jgi:hypothetical protein